MLLFRSSAMHPEISTTTDLQVSDSNTSCRQTYAFFSQDSHSLSYKHTASMAPNRFATTSMSDTARPSDHQHTAQQQGALRACQHRQPDSADWMATAEMLDTPHSVACTLHSSSVLLAPVSTDSQTARTGWPQRRCSSTPRIRWPAHCWQCMIYWYMCRNHYITPTCDRIAEWSQIQIQTYTNNTPWDFVRLRASRALQRPRPNSLTHDDKSSSTSKLAATQQYCMHNMACIYNTLRPTSTLRLNVLRHAVHISRYCEHQHSRLITACPLIGTLQMTNKYQHLHLSQHCTPQIKDLFNVYYWFVW